MERKDHLTLNVQIVYKKCIYLNLYVLDTRQNVPTENSSGSTKHLRDIYKQDLHSSVWH